MWPMPSIMNFLETFKQEVMCLAASMPFINLASIRTALSSKWLKHFYPGSPLTLVQIAYRINS